ncbi:MAG: hypothetical protein ACK56I_35370, partial [bacterium]
MQRAGERRERRALDDPALDQRQRRVARQELGRGAAGRAHRRIRLPALVEAQRLDAVRRGAFQAARQRRARFRLARVEPALL